ncbi:serine hydrolase [Mucilaginibacter sp. PPCGB 2223]|uniref:serine hydrolase domain-containing protein n=1 Tax=Mucilaginibacter sp. PPCGB 2223 TaxID=1886027 RepID=UPI0015860F02|nr:serine hydrolase domain-containing protein [Mucilaginibacter sp. PPCGB 2223]
MKSDLKIYNWLAIGLMACTIYPANAQLKTFSGQNMPVKRLERFISQQMDSLGMPALSIAFISNNKIIYHKAWGINDVNTRTPVNDASIFEAASMSKTAFTYWVMQMAEKGKLNLDTPLYRYLPYPDIAQDKRYKLITARMVLSHQAGFPNWRYFEKPDSALHVKYGDLWLKFTPGTQFAYSGEGYHYLAQVVAYLNHVDLKTLNTLYQQEVSRPFGLQHFYFSGNSYITQHKVSGHSKGKSIGRPWPISFPKQDSSWFGAAGGLHTESMDYARFLIALMEHKGIRKTSLDEMLKEQVKVPPTDDAFTSGEKAWGLGIAIMPTVYGTIYEHGGNNGDFQSGFKYLKARRTGFVFFTNCDKGSIFNNNLTAFMMAH